MKNKRSINVCLFHRDSVNWKGKVLHTIIKTYAQESYLKSRYPSWHCDFCVHTLSYMILSTWPVLLMLKPVPTMPTSVAKLCHSLPLETLTSFFSSWVVESSDRDWFSLLSLMHYTLHSSDLFTCFSMLSSAFAFFFLSNTTITGGLVFLKSQKM